MSLKTTPQAASRIEGSVCINRNLYLIHLLELVVRDTRFRDSFEIWHAGDPEELRLRKVLVGLSESGDQQWSNVTTQTNSHFNIFPTCDKNYEFRDLTGIAPRSPETARLYDGIVQ